MAKLCTQGYFGKNVADIINVFQRGIPSQRKTNKGIGRILLPQGDNNVGGNKRAGRTSGTTGSANSFDIQSTKQGDTVSAFYNKGSRICQSFFGRADELHSFVF